MGRTGTVWLLTIGFVAVSVAPAWAGTVSVGIDYDPYFKQSIKNDGDQCYATSVINSFRYLELRYPTIYGTKLTGGTTASMTTARNTLNDSIWDGAEGFTWEEAWEEKVNWVESRVSGKTAYKGMFAGSKTGWDNAENVKAGESPTWNWLWGEIKGEEDVEIFFKWTMKVWDDEKKEWVDELVGHAVTLTSLTFEDTNSNGTWDPASETEAQIDFVDPNSPTGKTWVDVSMSGGALSIKYEYGTTTYDAEIYGAFSESYIPLPGAAVSGLSLLGLMLTRRVVRRRFRSQKSQG